LLDFFGKQGSKHAWSCQGSNPGPLNSQPDSMNTQPPQPPLLPITFTLTEGALLNFLQSSGSQVSVVMGPGPKFLTRVGSHQPSLVRVWVWKIFPKNTKFFNFFPFGSKKNLFGSGQKVSTPMCFSFFPSCHRLLKVGPKLF